MKSYQSPFQFCRSGHSEPPLSRRRRRASVFAAGRKQRGAGRSSAVGFIKQTRQRRRAKTLPPSLFEWKRSFFTKQGRRRRRPPARPGRNSRLARCFINFRAPSTATEADSKHAEMKERRQFWPDGAARKRPGAVRRPRRAIKIKRGT